MKETEEKAQFSTENTHASYVVTNDEHVHMNDQEFTIYWERYVYLGGKIKNGCLQLDSEVYGDEYDSEKHYMFSKTETDRLFSLCSLSEFIELCRRGRLLGMEAFLSKNCIRYESVTI